MQGESAEHGRDEVNTLAALLDAVVTIGTGSVSGGEVLSLLPDRGPAVIGGGPTHGDAIAAGSADAARIESLADLLHIVIPAGRQRIDVLVPGAQITLEADRTVIAEAWLDRVRIAAASARLGAADRSEDPDWSALTADQAVSRAGAAHRYSQVLERSIERYIRDNDREALLQQLAIEPLARNAGRLAGGNTLRGVQDLAISLLTVAARSAIDAGTSVPMAFSISDHFIVEIERVVEASAVPPLLLRIATALAEAVMISRQMGRSALVRSAEDWIFVHLDGPLRPAALAEALGVSSAYLAARFRAETGLSIDTYVQRRRVEQARTLLTHTTLSIPEIYTQLAFYDQSHFSRVFRKHAGESPRQYRVRTRARRAVG